MPCCTRVWASAPSSREPVRISAGMFAAAASAVSSLVTVRQPGASLLPHIDDLRSVSVTVAVAVAETAEAEGLAGVKFGDIVQQVQDAMWQTGVSPDTGMLKRLGTRRFRPWCSSDCSCGRCWTSGSAQNGVRVSLPPGQIIRFSRRPTYGASAFQSAASRSVRPRSGFQTCLRFVTPASLRV